MTAETIKKRITAANIPLDTVFVKTISEPVDDETAERQLQLYINDEPFRNFIIAIDKIYSRSETEFNKLANELETIYSSSQEEQ